jgi:hypothetical protein
MLTVVCATAIVDGITARSISNGVPLVLVCLGENYVSDFPFYQEPTTLFFAPFTVPILLRIASTANFTLLRCRIAARIS